MIPLAETMRDLYGAFDRGFARWLERAGRRPSCATGCSACCELLALITWPEALLVAEVLRERRLVERFAPALAEQARRASFPGVDARTYFAARIPCALLEADGTCAVYDARPGPCRFHVAFTPPALCADRTPGVATESVDTAPVLRELVGPVLQDLDEQGVPEAREAGPLPVMVLAALREFGEDVEVSITPRAWLERYGEHVWGYHRGEEPAATTTGGPR